MRRILLGICLWGIFSLSNPLYVHATDVENGQEQSSEEIVPGDGGTQEESQPLIMEGSDDVIAYQKGDLPYVVQQDDVIIAYNVIHADGTVSSMSEGEFTAYYLKYRELTNDWEPHFGTAGAFLEERRDVVMENAPSKEEAALALAIKVTYVSDIPPEDEIQWTIIEKDGVTHYIYVNMNDGKYYEADEVLYSRYQIQKNEPIDPDTQTIDNGAIGYGTILFTCNVSERIERETLVLTVYYYFDNTTQSYIINSPYNATITLEQGKYRVEEICLYDHYEYPLEYDKIEFDVEEFKTETIVLDVKDPLDEISIAATSEEQRTAINEDYQETIEKEQVEETIETPAKQPEAVKETVVSEKKHGMGGIIILALAASVIVIVGLVAFYRYRKKMYEY